MRALSICLLAAILFGRASLSGQRIIYNKGLDNKGKATDATAAKLTSSATTDQELQNLAVLEKAQIDRILNAATVTMRRDIESFSTWGVLINLVEFLRQNADAVDLSTLDSTDVKKQQEEADAQAKALKSSLDRLKMASRQKPASLDPVLNILGNVADLNDFVGEAAKIKETADAAAAIQKVTDGLKEANALVDTVRNIWASGRAIQVDPRSLAPSIEETELAVLTVEIQYLRELTLLRARKQLDDAEVRGIAGQLLKEIGNEKLTPDRQIRVDLDALAKLSPSPDGDVTRRRQMRARVHILYLAASVSAQNTIATDIETVRETLAWRRYQIRSAAVYNGTYETAIQAASARLSAYYSAGLKPSQIAQLLHDLAAAVSLPKIAF